MKEKIDTQTRKDPGALFVMDGGGSVLSAWVAEERGRISGQELTEAEGRAHADFAKKAKARELEAWEQVKGSPPVNVGAQFSDMVNTRWALIWTEVDGVQTVKARLVAKGYRDSNLRTGDVDIAGCVSRRSSQLQLISLVALMNWPPWSLDIANAFLRADGFDREVYLRAPCGWNSEDTRRV